MKRSELFCLAFLLLACSSQDNQMTKKLIVIGMDGLDPKLTQKWMDEGKLPNFKALSEQGSFSELQTSNPPQSPVAWSNFICGHNPGHHDVFDFINRNPKTYLPEIGMTETRKVEKKTFRDLWKGLSGPSIVTRRKGRSFWDYLTMKGIPSTIIHCPVTFPAEELKGRLISGMGTPDIKGTQGIFSFFTTSDVDKKDIQGRVSRVAWRGNEIRADLTGPKVRRGDKVEEVSVPLVFEKIDENSVKIILDGNSQTINVGEWSEWFRVSFKVGFMNKVSGIVRFHFNSMAPDFAMYASAVNIDPKKPAMKISHPDDYAKEVYEKIGSFYTQGMPYDTWAVNEGRLDEEAFIDQAYDIQKENLAHLNFELERFNMQEGGFLFAYFGITDLISHMFWRYIDPKHPNKGTNQDPKVRDAIERVYIHMDGVLGQIRSKADKEALFLVISDHGFNSFRRAAHVNSWLRDNGYLVLSDESGEGKELFQNIDWSQTKAYSVGFGGIYVNQFGREKYGIVYKGAETETLLAELSNKLKEWKDTDGSSIAKEIYRREQLYSGPFSENGPDLFIGYGPGFRSSWQTALGAAPKPLIENNMKFWGGDHLCDPSIVPGVLISNHKINAESPKLLDLAPSILRYFGIKPESTMEGQSLL